MNTVETTDRRSRVGLIALAYIAFISLGLPDGLLGVAWPSIRADFGLPLDSLGLLLLASMSGYLTSSFFNGRLMARLGLGGLLAGSCALTGGSLLGYTLAPVWPMILVFGVAAGFGAGAIDAGINTYIASEHSEGLMQWLHASFGVGITLGPIIMTAGLNAFGAWRVGYTAVGIAQLALAACFAFTAGLWKRPQEEPGTEEKDRRILDYQTSLRDTLSHPRTWFSVLLFFLYTGVELSLGHWAYTLLTESRGIEPATAGLWAGSYWGTFTLGRALAGLYTNRIGVKNLLTISIGAALCGDLLLWWNPLPGISLLGVAVTGFAIAPVFPALVSGTRERVGARHTANTIGIQISAAGFGGTLLPGFAGVLARNTTLESIPLFLVVVTAMLLGLHLLLTRSAPGD